MNLIKSYIMKKFSKVPNVSTPSFSDEKVLQIIRDAGFGFYIDEYKRAPSGTGEHEGYWGFWTRQVAGIGVKNPIIYYNEVYSFVKNGNKWSCVVSWRYDTNDKIIDSPIVQEYKDVFGSNIPKIFQFGTRLVDGNDVIGNFNSFELAKKTIEEDIQKFQNVE